MQPVPRASRGFLWKIQIEEATYEKSKRTDYIREVVEDYILEEKDVQLIVQGGINGYGGGVCYVIKDTNLKLGISLYFDDYYGNEKQYYVWIKSILF